MAHFTLPVHVITGEHILKEAVPYFKEMGTQGLIVTGRHVVKSEMMEELKTVLKENGIRYTVFSGVSGEPEDWMAEEGKELYLKNSCDFVIGIGGGSALDTAKAIAAAVAWDGDLSDFNGGEITKCACRIAAIPTTAGTGSEATRFTVITDTKRDIKMLLKGSCLMPYLAVVDETYNMSAPKTVAVSTGLDALTHAVEAYISKKAMDLTDTLAVSAVKRILTYLPKACRDRNDKEAGRQMALAALEAGICINNSSVTLVHGMSRPLGALFHVPHGLSNAMLLYPCLTFVKDVSCEQFAQLAKEAGIADREEKQEQAAERFLEKIKELCGICRVPSIKEYGIQERAYLEQIDKMARDALDSGSPANVRKEISMEDVKELYRKAYENK